MSHAGSGSRAKKKPEALGLSLLLPATLHVRGFFPDLNASRPFSEDAPSLLDTTEAQSSSLDHQDCVTAGHSEGHVRAYASSSTCMKSDFLACGRRPPPKGHRTRPRNAANACSKPVLFLYFRLMYYHNNSAPSMTVLYMLNAFPKSSLRASRQRPSWPSYPRPSPH